MQRITQKIQVHERLSPHEDHFTTEMLTPSAVTSFTCGHCGTQNPMTITPYQTGFPFVELYRNAFLSETVILHTQMVTKSASWASHFGAYLVENLPTLYFQTSCPHCNTSYLVVFGYGERQPGQWICKISGIWRITEVQE